MATKIYNKTLSTIADGSTGQDTVLVSEDFELKQIAFSTFSNNSSNAVYFGMAIDDKNWADSDMTMLVCLQPTDGNIFVLPDSIFVKAKSTIAIKILNSSGASLTTIQISLQGKVNR